MTAAERTALTFRCERGRAVASGVLETAGITFLLLIAVRHFHAGAVAKAMVAGSGSVGLMLAPLVVSQVERWRWPVNVAASRLALVGAGCFLLMALFPGLPVFVPGTLIALAANTAAIPLMTQIFQENYPERERGRLFSRTVMIRIATAAIFSELAGRALSGRLERFPWLLLAFAGAFGLAAYCLARCPSQPLQATAGSHPFKALRFVKEDSLFRLTLIMWMLMGFGNLMMIPLRVEYLANPLHGVTLQGAALTAAHVALFTGVIPNLARLLMSPVWGWLFDRVNFFALRIAVNLGFAIGIGSFFGSHSMLGLGFAAVIFGISNAGGDVAWSLWVTKFAPPERVADYMSVHTFFTGLRGVVAPFVGFYLAAHWTIAQISWLSVALIVASVALMIPELKAGRGGRRAEALVEEVSE
jgi:MFS family permease